MSGTKRIRPQSLRNVGTPFRPRPPLDPLAPKYDETQTVCSSGRRAKHPSGERLVHSGVFASLICSARKRSIQGPFVSIPQPPVAPKRGPAFQAQYLRERAALPQNPIPHSYSFCLARDGFHFSEVLRPESGAPLRARVRFVPDM